jgi:hypothetical protein
MATSQQSSEIQCFTAKTHLRVWQSFGTNRSPDAAVGFIPDNGLAQVVCETVREGFGDTSFDLVDEFCLIGVNRG